MESTSDSLNRLLITSPLDDGIKNDDLAEALPSRSVSPVPDDERNLRREDISESIPEKSSTSSDLYEENKNETKQGIIHEHSHYGFESYEMNSKIREELNYLDIKLELDIASIDSKILKKKNKILNKQLDPCYNGEKERIQVAIQSNANKKQQTKELFKKKRREKISRFLHLTKTN